MSPQSLIFAALLAVSAFHISTNHAGAADLPQQIQAGEHRLVLNGWGARNKTLLQLYIAGLYLPRPNNNPAAIVSADEPMAIRIQITSGFVSQTNLASSLAEGFHNSTGGNVAPIQRQIDLFQECLKEEITKGDVFDLVYIPAHGVIVNKNGRLRGVIAGAEFKKALFSIWLSDTPADKALKQAMLTRGAVR